MIVWGNISEKDQGKFIEPDLLTLTVRQGWRRKATDARISTLEIMQEKEEGGPDDGKRTAKKGAKLGISLISSLGKKNAWGGKNRLRNTGLTS